MSKRVVVQMSDDCHKALKQYAAFYGMTMSEVLYQCTRMQFHRQRESCKYLGGVLNNLDIVPDKRASKPCFSFMCFSCNHLTACQTGFYKGVCEVPDEVFEKDLLTEFGKRALTDLQLSAGQSPQLKEWVKAA